jgi:lactose/L-arabinose transport system substrate-binding protein
MKKRLISLLTAGVLAVSMVPMSAFAEEAPAADVASEDENTLSVYAWDANFNIPALEAAEADYQKNVNPDFKLDIITQSGSSDVENAVTLAGQSGDYSNLPDIVLFQDHYFQQFYVSYPDAWLDLADADINWDDFGAEKLSYSTIEDTHFGVPVDNGTAIMAYRTDLLEEAGYSFDDMVGCTWDKFIEVGEAVYEKTGKYLLCMDGSGNDLPYMMLQAEGESQFTDGEPTFATNEKYIQIIKNIVTMIQKNVLYLGNDWSDYTDQAIIGDMVAGVLNGNWIIPTMEQAAENSGKWEITSLPTLEGGEGYASNGGSSLYITGNCSKPDLAADFLAKTFGAGSTETYDAALKNGGVITCSISAGESDVYQEGVEFFNDQPIYADIVAMGAFVPVIEQSDYHYQARQYVGTAIQNLVAAGEPTDESVAAALQDAQDQLSFEMAG